VCRTGDGQELSDTLNQRQDHRLGDIHDVGL